MLELPLVLGMSWLVARRLLGRNPALSSNQALAIGLLAFAMLMAAEAVLAHLLGGSIGDWLTGMRTPAGVIGLLGQVGFGLVPWLVVRSARS